MSLKLFFLLPLLALLQEYASAQDSGSGKAIILDIPVQMRVSKPLFLSDIATSVRYLALETTNKYLIGENTVSVKPCGGLFFVSQHEKPVGVFDSSGRFLRTIGRIGRGPGEYNFDYLAWPDETLQRLYVWNADNGTIMSFSWEGKHLGDIKPEIKPGAFAPLGNDRFITWTFMQEQENGRYYRMVIHDEKGKTLYRIFEPKKKYDFSRGIAIMMPLLSKVENGLLYNSWENDSIMRISADGSFSPVLTCNLGKLKMPYDPMSVDFNRYMREKDNYVLSFNALESTSRWFASYDYKKRSELAIVDKATGEFFRVADPDTASQGIFNDIDGGPSFWPYGEMAVGKSFLRVIQAIDLVKPEVPRRSGLPVKQPAEAKKLRELVSKLTENSNPVLMLVDLM